MMRECEIAKGFPQVLGIVDGTHVKVCCDNIDIEAYMNRKGFTSINNLVMVDYDEYFIYV